VKIAAAQRARDDARALLDQSLERRGWRRLRGAFDPHAAPLYTHLSRPDAVLTLHQVLEVLEVERRSAAA
jgi:hypothetical protein